MVENEKQPSLDSWNDYAGEFIKAENVKETPASMPIIDVRSDKKDGRARFFLEVEYQGRTWTFECNKTNQAELIKTGLMPKELRGKVIELSKVKVTNPSTNQIVDSLYISKVIVD